MSMASRWDRCREATAPLCYFQMARAPVIAGREDATLIDYARKVLEVQVRAGEALVLEYLVNDSVLDES